MESNSRNLRSSRKLSLPRLLLAAGATVSELEDLIVKENPRKGSSDENSHQEGSKPEKKKVHFIVMVESVENLVCYQFHMSDEVVTYYWVLDCISHGELVNTDGYKLPGSTG
jgi:UDP-glucose 6-dehydrogenase